MSENNTYLVITPFFPSNNSFVGSYIFDQLNEMRKQSCFNIEVVKAVSLFSTEKDYVYMGFSVRIFKVIDFPFFILPGLFNWINKIRLSNLLKFQKIKDVKLVHCHVSYPCAYLAEDMQCKKIIQHHGLDALQLLNGRSEFIKNIQRRFVITHTIKHLNNFDLNIGVSNLVLQEIRKYKIYSPNYEYVLYNGVDRSKFYKKENTCDDIFTIGCVANFWKIKGHIILIKSVEKLLEEGTMIKLRLIGSGPTLKSCKKYVYENNLSKYIIFESEVAHHELNNFYNEIDLFVLPSYYEAFGCVYMESWAAETPFIAIEGQGISEIVPDKNKMLSAQNDVDDLLNKIKFFIENKFMLKSVSIFDIKRTIHDFLLLDIFNKDD